MKITSDMRILAGITQDNELYFLEVSPMIEGNRHFSMSGFTVDPISKEDAERDCKDYIDYNAEYFWKDAVAAGRTTQGLEEWKEDAYDEDPLGGFDNSLFDEEIEVDGIDYLFRSQSCGQHEESILKHYFISPGTFVKLLAFWHKYHLKEVKPEDMIDMPTNNNLNEVLESIEEQDVNALAAEAINIINQ